MTFLHKLAKRLSLTGSAGTMSLLLASLVGCAPAEDRDLLGTTPSVVSPPIGLTISPRAGSVKPGEEIRFTAAGRSVAGGSVPVEVEWLADGGTITADGRFVAPQHGQFRVTVKARQYPHLADSALVAVFNAPTDILLLSVTPDSSLITEGEGIQLRAEARLADGSTSQRPPVRWSASGGRVDGSGWFSSLEPGDYRVEAVSTGGVRGQVTVLVRPNVRITASIEVVPGALSLTYGEARQLRAIAQYADGSEGPAQVLWSATGGTIGSDGQYTAGSTTGNFRIIARTSGTGIADTVMVSVTEPPMTAVRVSPGTATLLPGATQQFVATALLGDGSTRSVGVTWTATGGTILANGQYTAGAIQGAHRVIATVPGTSLVDTAVIQVVTPATSLERVLVNPRAVGVPVGTSRQFTVTGVYSDGATRIPAVTWSATGGTITPAGSFTAGTIPGTYRVVATGQGGKADTSVIAVTAASLEQLILNPSSVTLAPGATRSFSASGRWSDGSSGPVSVVFQAEGGTIAPNGIYTAGSQPGTWRLIARQDGGSLADTSLVTIEPPAPALRGLSLAPKTVSLRPDQTVALAVQGRWTDGSATPPPVVWSATGGHVVTPGIYTAASTAGSFVVVARTVDGQFADTTHVTVTASAPSLVAMAVAPRQTALQTSGTRQFYVTGTLSDGSAIVPAVTWTATAGVVTNGGLYIGSVPGTHRVIATQRESGLADTAEVTVSDPVRLVAIEVSPDTAVIQAGAPLRFAALGLWSNGATGTTDVAWSAKGGTISLSGEFRAGLVPGVFPVIAHSTATGLADTALVRVVGGPTVARLRVTPAAASLAAGMALHFSAEATWSDGVVRPAPVAWEATGGTMTADGFFLAGPTAGSFRVVAASGMVADTALVTVTVPPAVTRFVLSPDSVALAPGGVQQFSVAATWSDGATRAVSVSYRVSGGVVTSEGRFTAGQMAGRFLVIATCGCGITDSSVVTVVEAPPVPASVRVAPDSASLLAGGTIQFTAQTTWSDGVVRAAPVTWSATGGSISAEGLFTAGAAGGAFRVIGSVGSLADTAMMVVTLPPVVTRVLLNPATVALGAGEAQQFTASVIWSDGASRPATVGWSATGGTITNEGRYTAGTAGGAFGVIASVDGVADTSTVTVTVPPTVTRVGLSPDSVVLAPAGTQQFSAATTWSDGATRPVTVTYSATGGSVSSTGIYTAGASAGRFLVVALCACGAADTSVVTVAAAAPTLTALRVAPDTAELATGGRLQFRATGTTSDGGTTSPSVTWTATGGTIDGQGVYTAPSLEGTYTIAAAHTGSGLRATALVKVATVPVDTTEVMPELPRVYLDTRFVPKTGKSIRVASGGNLQAALDEAQPGDEILLAPRAEFRGSFRLRKKTGTGWITIRTDTQLPPEGVRVTPATAVNFAKLIATSGGSAAPIRTDPGAANYRIMGVEITAAENVTSLTMLVRLHVDDVPWTMENFPKNIIVDRAFVHGHPNLDLLTCVRVNSIATAVIDSYLSRCHSRGQDAQAIAGEMGPGPYKIVNNYLEASGENIMFGGGDPRIDDLSPSDVEIRRNHLFKPLDWKDKWLVKNLFELKHARRVLVEANVMENNWVDGQAGAAILFKSVSQYGRAPWSITADVTFRYNVIRNSPQAFNIASTPGVHPAQPARRIRVEHNLLLEMGSSYLVSLMGSAEGGLSDVHFVQNTFIPSADVAGALSLGGQGVSRGLVMRGNVLPMGKFGFKGSGTAAGTASLNAYWSSHRVVGNALVGAGNAAAYPGANTWLASLAAAGVGDDGRLTAGSSLRNRAPGGGDIGADADEVWRRVQGVVVP